MLKTSLAACFITLFLLISTHVDATEWSSGNIQYMLSTEYSSGGYGHEKDTDILYIPFSIKYETLPWRFGVTVPYIKITGPGNIVGGGGGGGIPVNQQDDSNTSQTASIHNNNTNKGSGGNGSGGSHGQKNQITTEKGLGDIIIESSYALDMSWDLPFYTDVTAKLKIPTADADNGLGTGKTDFALQVDIAEPLHSENLRDLTPFVTLGYRWMGKPDDYHLNNIWFTSLGLDYKINPYSHGGFSYDYRQDISSSGSEVSEILLYYNFKFKDHWDLGSYAVTGFSDGSPDYGIGFQLRYIAD
jgi:hypothetical protein